jgi:hypothetical protein
MCIYIIELSVLCSKNMQLFATTCHNVHPLRKPSLLCIISAVYAWLTDWIRQEEKESVMHVMESKISSWCKEIPGGDIAISSIASPVLLIVFCHLKLCFWEGEKSKDIMRHKTAKTPSSKDGQQGEIREK